MSICVLEMHVKPVHDDVIEDVYFPDPVIYSETWQSSDVDGVHIPAAAIRSIQQGGFPLPPGMRNVGSVALIVQDYQL